jgi:MFS superfamily sulfate permease-like transporter
VPGASGVWHAQPVATRAQALPGLLIYRFTHSMYYANAQQLSDEMLDLVTRAQPPLRWFCIEASAVDDVDYSAAETLRALFAILEEQGIRLVVTQVMEDVRERSRYELLQLFSDHAFYDTLGHVVQAYQQQSSA